MQAVLIRRNQRRFAMFRSGSRRQHLSLLFAFTLLIALVISLGPNEEAQAQSRQKHRMVGSSGTTLLAPDADNSVEELFAGSGDLAGITAENDSAEAELLPISSPLGIESVIGTDSRTRVNTTTNYPYRANAFLKVTYNGGSGTCTGFFIGPRTLATAGHCVFDQALGWATSIQVFPGRNGGSSPYGSAYACYLWSVDGWVNDDNTNYDYGAIILPSNKALGNTVGWYGYFYTTDGASLDEDQVRIYGYPGDKTYATQWGMQGKIKRVYNRKLHHNLDTAGGQSGSAVYETRSNGPYANSIHTNGVYGTSPYNRSTRIVKGVFNNLKNWKNNPDCTP
jgi:glutamyl endopeptidase